MLLKQANCCVLALPALFCFWIHASFESQSIGSHPPSTVSLVWSKSHVNLDTKLNSTIIDWIARRHTECQVIRNVPLQKWSLGESGWPNSTCTEKLKILHAIGMDGALHFIELKSFHALTQMVAHVLMEVNATISCSLSFVHDLHATIARNHLGTVGSLAGLYHGMIWYAIATYHENWNATLSWFPPEIVRSWSSSRYVFAPYGIPRPAIGVHGLGHGFFIRHARAESTFGPCYPPPTSYRSTTLQLSMHDCLTAPTRFIALGCMDGLWHTWVEYTDGSYGHSDWLYPCSAWVESMVAWCFAWAFSQGLYEQGRGEGGIGRKNFTRSIQLASLPGHISAVCLTQDMAEVNVRGCIWGLSSAFYLYFHEGWIARSRYGLALEQCLKTPKYWTSGSLPHVSCPLIFKRGKATGRDNWISRSSLVEWCSFFVEDSHQPYLSVRDLKRWLACIHGSVSYNSYMPIATGTPMSVLNALCKHDQTWQSANTTFTAITIFCLNAWTRLSPIGASWNLKDYQPLVDLGLIGSEAELFEVLGFDGWKEV